MCNENIVSFSDNKFLLYAIAKTLNREIKSYEELNESNKSDCIMMIGDDVLNTPATLQRLLSFCQCTPWPLKVLFVGNHRCKERALFLLFIISLCRKRMDGWYKFESSIYGLKTFDFKEGFIAAYMLLPLSTNKRGVLYLSRLLSGETQFSIAKTEGIKVKAVSYHIRSLLRNFGMRSWLQLYAFSVVGRVDKVIQ